MPTTYISICTRQSSRTGAHPHLMISVGKEGRVYAVNRDNMGRFTAYKKLQCGTKEESRTDIDKIVQKLPTGTT